MAQSAAKRYAEAVFSLAKEQGTLGAWAEDLARLNSLLEDPQVARFFDNPNVSQTEKIQIMDEALTEGQPEARNLGRILVERNRVGIIPELCRQFGEALLADQGIAIANVTTAEPLSEQEQEAVRQQLGRVVGKEIELRLHTDPSIIGGVIAQIGDMLIDGSVANQLRRLRTRLETV